jgi:chromosome segregation and condensation protein ScpB/DNA-binding XRE family transcriptional regulator
VAVRAPSTDVGAELRRQRQLCRLSQARLAELSGVARTTINEIERGRRYPSVGTYSQLRDALGLEAAPAVLVPKRRPTTVTDTIQRRLCATVVAVKRLPLADLASALDISIPACREALLAAAPRFRELGCTVAEDGVEVALGYAEDVVDAVRRVTTVEEDTELSSEQLAILALIAVHGPLTRAAIQEWRGEDSETLLRRLSAKGILARVRDEAEPGGPYVYRIASKALHLLGLPTVEALRSYILEKVGPLTVDLDGARTVAESEAGSPDAVGTRVGPA